MKYQLNIKSNLGYDSDQVSGITVGELKGMLDGLDDEDQIITYDENNGYGASFGGFSGSLDVSATEEELAQEQSESDCIAASNHFKAIVAKGGFDYCFYCGGR